MYTYYEPKSPSIVTVSGDKAYTLPLKGQPDRSTVWLSDQKLSNMALLGSRSGITFLCIRRVQEESKIEDAQNMWSFKIINTVP